MWYVTVVLLKAVSVGTKIATDYSTNTSKVILDESY
jgi:hypothetical protein